MNTARTTGSATLAPKKLIPPLRRYGSADGYPSMNAANATGADDFRTNATSVGRRMGMNAARTTGSAEGVGESSGQGAQRPAYPIMNTANAAEARTHRKNVVERINAKLGTGRSLVARRELVAAPGTPVYETGRWPISYRLAEGDLRTSRYEVSGPAVDLLELATRLGVRLSSAEVEAFSIPLQGAA